MAFLEVLSVIGFGRLAAKSLRKSEIYVLCNRCTTKNDKVTKTRHVRATDQEELKKQANYGKNNLGTRAADFAIQQVGLQEVINFIDNTFTYKCTKCSNLRAVSRSKCF
jgi:DNA-directed RNA polymerase subunit RPC12/RpoP